MHNSGVRRLVAACLLALFAILATGDTFACPDGCQSTSSMFAADRCNSSGQCAFCAGAIVTDTPHVVIGPLIESRPPRAMHDPRAAFPPVAVPDHPPRLT